jgi:hypothetical protein
MSTSDAGQIEEWIWNGGEKEDSWEAAKTEKEITFLYFVNNKDCTANIRIFEFRFFYRYISIKQIFLHIYYHIYRYFCDIFYCFV